MDRDSKSRISRSSDLRRPYLSSFFPSRTISCTLRTVKENGPETSRLQRRHRTGFTPVSLFTGPTFLLAGTHSVKYITYFPFPCQAPNIVNPFQFLPFLRSTIRKNPAKQDSPPAAGRVSDILHLRRSAIPRRGFLLYRNHGFCTFM